VHNAVPISNGDWRTFSAGGVKVKGVLRIGYRVFKGIGGIPDYRRCLTNTIMLTGAVRSKASHYRYDADVPSTGTMTYSG